MGVGDDPNLRLPRPSGPRVPGVPGAPGAAGGPVGVIGGVDRADEAESDLGTPRSIGAPGPSPSPAPEGAFEGQRDPAYPDVSPTDPVYPSQTLAPLAPTFAGIATPAIWARLCGPLGRALDQAWNALRLLESGRPRIWITLHYGRIAVNAHGWERLRARSAGEEPDAATIGPRAARLGPFAERVERTRARFSRRRLQRRVVEARATGRSSLQSRSACDVHELETAELARGPLDQREWAELLMPWLVGHLLGEVGEDPDVCAGLALESRFSSEVGRRLAADGLLRSPGDIAYLTLEERLRAVHETSAFWRKLVETRARRIESFVDIELPTIFWGTPRVDSKKTS